MKESSSSSWELDNDLEGLTDSRTYRLMKEQKNNDSNIQMPDPDINSGSSTDSLSDDSWCDTSESFLNGLIDRAKIELETHDKNRKFYATARHTTGIPSVLIGVVMGSITESSPLYVQKGAFMLNAIICSLSYYFDFAHKQKLNNKAYDDYTQFINDIEQCLSLPRSKREKARTTIDSFSKAYIKIQSDSP